MTYKHGVYTSEKATSLVPMTQTDSGLIVAIGTAPVHLAKNPAKPNTPVLCYTYQEAVEAFGYSDDWQKYTLCEAMKTQFALFNMAPIVLINVLNPDTHKKEVKASAAKLTDRVATIEDAIQLDTLKVTLSAEGTALADGKDYTAAFDEDGKLIITALDDGGITKDAESIYVSYTALDPTAVKTDDIVGGVNTDGAAEGLELIDSIYPRFGLVPGILIAPGWSDQPTVIASMCSKTENVDGHFSALAVCDAPTDTVKTYTAVSEWKNKNAGSNKNCVLCWPKVKLGTEVYHLSTQLASLMNYTDSQNDDIPYVSPSNKSLQADSACLDKDTEVYLTSTQAAYLNGQGVVTALNFIGGWRSWGNRTIAYPSNTDVKDNFITSRRMFEWVGNTLVTTFWNKIDDPTNRRLIETIVDSANIWLNGLTAKGALLGGATEFREEDNTQTDLEDGILHFHVSMTPPAPAREIDFVQEYNTEYISNLFA